MSNYDSELELFPPELRDSFNKSFQHAMEVLDEDEFVSWAEIGFGIARKKGRSWEAARDYFRASDSILRSVQLAYFMHWARAGKSLAEESPIMASSYFKSSSEVVRYIKPWDISEWAQLGRKLYDSTRRSNVLAVQFFEASPEVLRVLSFSELRHFLLLVEAVAENSVDDAVSFVRLASETLPSLKDDIRSCLSLISSLIKTDYKQVSATLEIVGQALDKVSSVERARLLALTGKLVENGGIHAPTFLRETAKAFSQTSIDLHKQVMDMAEDLTKLDASMVPNFIQGVPFALRRVSINQLGSWYDEGVAMMEENPDATVAFFKGESAYSERMLEKLSVSVELGRIKELMQMYCRALTAVQVDISPPPEGESHAKGWVALEKGITEEAVVYLPWSVSKFENKEDNFDWYKVVTTHQLAHLEFESFLFAVDKPANIFANLRYDLDLADSDDMKLENSDPENEQSDGGEISDMQRFFGSFDDGRLVRDIFTAVEDYRLDYRVLQEYQGIKTAYRNVQLKALDERPIIQDMPAKEAMVELLIRFGLRQTWDLKVPDRYREWTKTLWNVMRHLGDSRANVEDSAEATLRLYRIISQIPNEDIPDEEWQENEFPEMQSTGLEKGQMDEQEMEDMLQQLLESMAEGLGGEDRPYQSPPQVDYRGEFKPEMIQLLSLLKESQRKRGAQGDKMTQEQMESMLTAAEQLSIQPEEGDLKRSGVFITETVEEVGSKGSPEGAIKPVHYPYDPYFDQEEQGGPLEVKESHSYLYDEWDYRIGDYKPRWCLLREKDTGEGDSSFYSSTLESYASLASQIRRQFELIAPQGFRKMRRMQDGDDFDLDAIIEAVIDRKSGVSPSENVYNNRNKVQRDVAVVFLLDMSASTAEAIDESRRLADEWDAPDDPLEYMFWLRGRRGEGVRRSYKRIVDVEKESLVLLIQALEIIGDSYGIYGFSGYGRENVDFYVIKDVEEPLSDKVKKRIDKVSPLQATRMGPAIRHAITKLEKHEARSKFLFLISDGRPQDRGYSREGVEKEYAIHDTKVALTEAKQKGITPFCLTVDKEGHDYLRTMCQDIGYEVLADINALPSRLPLLYRQLTV